MGIRSSLLENIFMFSSFRSVVNCCLFSFVLNLGFSKGLITVRLIEN